MLDRRALMQSALLLFLIACGCAAKLVVLWKCFSYRMVGRHAWFCAFTALSFVRSSLFLNGHPHPAYEFWNAVQWPMAILQCGAALEAFWLIARHFRNIRGFGFALLGVMTIVGAAVAAGVGAMRPYWEDPLRGAILFNQYTYMGLLVITVLSLAFFWQFSGVPVPRNASRHLLVLAILFASYFFGNFLGQISKGRWPFQANLVIDVGTVVAYAWWAIGITEEGDRLPFSKAPPLSKDDFAAAEATEEKAARDVNRASSKALWKILRRWRTRRGGR
jgi:hypothetical protein